MSITGTVWRLENNGWGVTAWDGMVEGVGRNVQEAVDDLVCEYIATYISEMKPDEVVMIDQHVELKLIGPAEHSEDETLHKVYSFDIYLPRLLSDDEKLLYASVSRPVIDVDAEFKPTLWNLPIEWQ